MTLPLHKKLQTTAPIIQAKTVSLHSRSRAITSICLAGLIAGFVLTLSLAATASEPREQASRRSSKLRRGNHTAGPKEAWVKPRLIVDSRGGLKWSKPERIMIEKIHKQKPSFINPPKNLKPISTAGTRADAVNVKRVSQNIELGEKKSIELKPVGTPIQLASDRKKSRFSLNAPENRSGQIKSILRAAPQKRTVREPAFVALQLEDKKSADTDSGNDVDILDQLIPFDDETPIDDLSPSENDDETKQDSEDTQIPKDESDDDFDPSVDLSGDDLGVFDDMDQDISVPEEADEKPVETNAESVEEKADVDPLKDLPSADDLGFGPDDLTPPAEKEDPQPARDGFSDKDEEADPRMDLDIEDDEKGKVRIPDRDLQADDQKTEDLDLSVFNGRNCPEDLLVYQQAWETFRRRPLTEISLDITPQFEPNAEPAEAAELRKDKLAASAARDWTDRHGKVIAYGQLEDFRDGMLMVRDGGQIMTINHHELSNKDLCFVNAWWGTPTEYRPEDVAYDVRNWTMTTFTWKASGLCHKPLYFEEVQLERYGHSAGPIKQPFLSGAHFFGNIFFLPYHMGMNPPNECQYSLGYYRPGNCAPWLLPAVPLSARGARLQLGAIVAGITLIP